MRLLLVNTHGADPTGGGAERYVRDLASGMSARGHDVEVLSAFPQRVDSGVETHVLHRTDWRDYRVRRLRNHFGDLVSAPWPRVQELLEDLRPELVHTNNLPGIGTGIWEAARRVGLSVVHTLHNHYMLCPRTTLLQRDGTPCRPHPLICGARARRLARWQGAVSVLVGPSEYILGAHRGVFPSARERVVRHPLKPPGASLSRAPDAPPRMLGYVGALLPMKGVRLLLAAAPALAERGFVVRIAGEGPLRSEVEASECVGYEGWLRGEAREAFVNSCDLGLAPSLCDEAGGPPYVVCEWLAAGRPVLATPRGGQVEADQASGVVPFDESPAGLVEEVLRLRSEEEWRQLIASVPLVEGDADVRRWLDEHEALYELAGEPARQPSPA